MYVQFRNWLGGARDLNLTHSANGGKTYAPAQKLGAGTWKLAGCLMDSGGVALSSTGQPVTTWRREDTLYVCQPGKPEHAIATGRHLTIGTSSAGPVVAWDEKGTIWVKATGKPPVSPGKREMPSLAIRGQKAVCVWEAQGQIMMETISL